MCGLARRLEQESISESAAVTATARALQQAQYRYKAGLVTYLEVATTETTALQAQLSRVTILNRRMITSVLLVKALGGGWQTAQSLALLSGAINIARQIRGAAEHIGERHTANWESPLPALLARKSRGGLNGPLVDVSTLPRKFEQRAP
jgi:hypothetical protein